MKTTPPAAEALTKPLLRSLWRDLHYSVRPLFGIRSRPHDYQVLDDVRQRRTLLHEKDTRRMAMGLKKVPEVVGHGLQVGSDENPISRGSQSKNIGVLNSLQPGLMRRLKVHRWLTTPTATHDAVVDARIRQIADHPSASPRQHLPPHALKLLFDFGRSWVCPRIFVFHPPAFNQVFFNFLFVAQIERDCAVDLLKAERGVVRPDRFGGFPVLKLVNDEGERHTAPNEVEAPLSLLNKFLHTRLVSSLSLFSFGPRGSLAFLVPSRSGWSPSSLIEAGGFRGSKQ